MSKDETSIDEMSIDEMSKDETSIDEMSIDEMTIYLWNVTSMKHPFRMSVYEMSYLWNALLKKCPFMKCLSRNFPNAIFSLGSIPSSAEEEVVFSLKIWNLAVPLSHFLG